MNQILDAIVDLYDAKNIIKKIGYRILLKAAGGGGGKGGARGGGRKGGGSKEGGATGGQGKGINKSASMASTSI